MLPKVCANLPLVSNVSVLHTHARTGSLWEVFSPREVNCLKLFVPLDVVDLVTNKLSYTVVELLVLLPTFNYASL